MTKDFTLCAPMEQANAKQIFHAPIFPPHNDEPKDDTNNKGTRALSLVEEGCTMPASKKKSAHCVCRLQEHLNISFRAKYSGANLDHFGLHFLPHDGDLLF
jgi:hypothetical protein